MKKLAMATRLALSRLAYEEDFRSLSSAHKCLLPVLAFGSLLYTSLCLLRHQLYAWSVFKSVRMPIPVISIGNITWGGNGKTPMVEHLTQQFLQCGISPLILTRGYAGGDEARLLRAHLHGTPAVVGVGRNRVKTATALLQKHGLFGTEDILEMTSRLCSCKNLIRDDQLEFKPESMSEKKHGIGVILLDDGMQHLKMKRDIEIVMINALSLFGNEKVMPCGPLREPLDALARADIVVIHHANLVSHERLKSIKKTLARFVLHDTMVYCTSMLPRAIFKIPSASASSFHNFESFFTKSTQLMVSLDILKGAHVLCVSGIGCPKSVYFILEKLGAARVEAMEFPDHHYFQPQDIFLIKQRLSVLQSKATSVSLVLLTEKDYARNPRIFIGPQCDFDVFILHSTLEIIDDSTPALDINYIIAQKIQKWKYEATT